MTKNYNLWCSSLRTSPKTPKSTKFCVNSSVGSGSLQHGWKLSLILSFILPFFLTQEINAQASFYTFAQSNENYNAINGGAVVTTSTSGTPNLDFYVSSNITISSVKRLNTTSDHSSSVPTDITSSSATDLFTDEAATIAYVSGSSANTVYVKSSTVGSQTYTVTATSNPAGCETTSTVTITKTETPQPVASAQSFCNGATVADLVATGTDIQWYNVASSGTALSSTAVLATGTYYVSQTINSVESSRTSVSITINTTPAPTSNTKVTFCIENPTVAMLFLLDEEDNPQYYLNATSGTSLNSDYVVSDGTYYISHTINNCESARTSFLVEIDMVTPPTASDQTFCAGAIVADLVANELAVKWYTDLVGGIALVGTTTLESGIYYAATSYFECESLRISVEVTINPLPNPTLTRTDDTLTASMENATYQWILCDTDSTPINGATSQSYIATSVGSYAVIVTQNGCSATSECFEIATLFNKTFDAAKLGYYPNPVQDVLKVSHTDIISGIQVFDITGRLVRNVKTNSTEVLVDMANMPASVYIVKVFTDSISAEFKVIKK
ncbi:MAG: T9SS type A sorting domain-containing protein [Flavobacterium sp.]